MADVLVGAGHAPPPEASPTLPEVAAAFDGDRGRVRARGARPPSCATCSSGPTRRRPRRIVKVLGGELRIGLREGLLEAAIARAFDRPLDDVKWAGMLTGDMGRLAELARDDRSATRELALFHPLKFMLASPAEDADEISRRLGPEVWVEDKYDGIRAQLHKRGDGRPPLQPRPARRQRPVPRGRRGARGAGLGRRSSTASSSAWKDGARPAVPQPPGAARPQVAVGGDPGGGPGHLRRLRRPRAR